MSNSGQDEKGEDSCSGECARAGCVKTEAALGLSVQLSQPLILNNLGIDQDLVIWLFD